MVSFTVWNKTSEESKVMLTSFIQEEFKDEEINDFFGEVIRIDKISNPYEGKRFIIRLNGGNYSDLKLRAQTVLNLLEEGTESYFENVEIPIVPDVVLEDTSLANERT